MDVDALSHYHCCPDLSRRCTLGDCGDDESKRACYDDTNGSPYALSRLWSGKDADVEEQKGKLLEANNQLIEYPE